MCDITFPQAESLHQVLKYIVILANDVRFEKVIEDNVIELLVSQRENLSSEELMLFEK